MSWSESDDNIADTCIQRLDLEERKLNQRLTKITIVKSGAKKIKTIIRTKIIKINEYQDEEKTITEIPKDISGDPMSDKYRLDHLKIIVEKTNDLLGKPEK